MALIKLPMRFADEANANSCITASGLFPIGARAVEGPHGWWLVVIDTGTKRPDNHLRFLKQHMPGVHWVAEEAPAEAAKP
jgi:hypothetical protein